MRSHLSIVLLLACLSPLIRPSYQSAAEIPITVEQAHTFLYGRMLPIDHKLAIENDYWYRYMRDCGIDADRVDISPLYLEVGGNASEFNHMQILADNDIQALFLPGRYPVIDDGDTLDPDFTGYVSWVGEACDWMPIWHNYWFAEAKGNNQQDHYEGRKLVGWKNGKVADGNVIGAPKRGNALYPLLRYLPLFNLTGDTVTLYLRMKRLTWDYPDNVPICKLLVWDSRIGIQEHTFSGSAFSQPEPDGWCRLIAQKMYIRPNARIALRWANGDDFAVSHIRYTTRRYDVLHPAEGESKIYLVSFLDQFRKHKRLADSAGVHLLGWQLMEPWRFSWEGVMELNTQIRSEIPGEYDLYATEPGYGKLLIDEYFDITNSDQILVDYYPITWNTSESSNPVGDSLSIQRALDDRYIEYAHDAFYRDKSGVRSVAIASKRTRKPFHQGIQVSGELDQIRVDEKNDTWTWRKAWYGGPTPRIVKLLGWIGMAYGARGFFYHYWSPIYLPRRDPGLMRNEKSDYYSELAEIGTSMNGAAMHGLLYLYPDYDHPEEKVIRDKEHLKSLLNKDSKAWLGPTDRWYAAKRFNETVDSLENFISHLFWENAGCAANHKNSFDFVDVLSTIDPISGKEDGKRWIEISRFKGGYRSNSAGIEKSLPFDAVCIVNRRAQADELRSVKVHFDWPSKAKFTIDPIHPNEKYPNRFNVTIPPAEGRFFIGVDIPDANIIGNQIWGKAKRKRSAPPLYIDRKVVIEVGSNLKIEPNSVIIFGKNGSIDIKGKLTAAGSSKKPVTFISYTKPLSGEITITDLGMADFNHCDFVQLKTDPLLLKNYNNQIRFSECQFLEMQPE